MSGSASPSDGVTADARSAHALAGLRVMGGYGMSVRLAGGGERGITRLAHLDERGGWRLRFPTVDGDAPMQAVSVNTGGGIVGGDHVRCAVDVPTGHLVLATQAAERIYKSLGPDARIETTLTIGNEARLDWLPQETILFSGARLQRRFDVALASSSRLLMIEMIVLGRTASGEIVRDGSLVDVWRVRRDGRLVFAEALRLDGAIAELMARPAIGGEARTMALLLYVAPDAADHLDCVRAILEATSCDSGASTWNGLLAVRALARDTAALRRAVIACAEAITGAPMPRVWSL